MTAAGSDGQPCDDVCASLGCTDGCNADGPGVSSPVAGSDGQQEREACGFRFVCCQMPHKCREQVGHVGDHRTHDHEAHADAIELPPSCDCGCHPTHIQCGECCYVAPGRPDTSANSDRAVLDLLGTPDPDQSWKFW